MNFGFLPRRWRRFDASNPGGPVHEIGGAGNRDGGIRRLGLHQPGQGQLLVLILVLLTMSLRTELAPTAQTLEEGKLLPAEQTLHENLDRPFAPNTLEPVRGNPRQKCESEEVS